MTVDTLIKNGKTIDEDLIEIAILDGKIVNVSTVPLAISAKKIIDLAGEYYVSAGWIDDHVHCFNKLKSYYDIPDNVGVKTGVTTVIDAGSTGTDNIGEFYELAKQAKTNVFALLNISRTGIVKQDELSDLANVRADLVQAAMAQYPDFIVGIKARMSRTVVGENGIRPLELAKDIQKANNNVPLMVHIGSVPPELESVLTSLTKGDIVTHCFNGKANGIMDQAIKAIKPFAKAAYDRGVIFDIGHGTDSFNFEVAKCALENGMKAFSISTDIYHRNRENGPVYNLTTTMEKMHQVGYSWPEIIEKVTAAPAKNFHLNNKGALKVGFDADISIFTLVEEKKILRDSNGNEQVTKTVIKPAQTIIGGLVYDNQF